MRQQCTLPNQIRPSIVGDVLDKLKLHHGMSNHVSFIILLSTYTLLKIFIVELSHFYTEISVHLLFICSFYVSSVENICSRPLTLLYWDIRASPLHILISRIFSSIDVTPSYFVPVLLVIYPHILVSLSASSFSQL